MPGPFDPFAWIPRGHQQLTSITTATSLTVPPAARMCIMNCENQSVRWLDDGSAPSSTLGMLMKAADPSLIYYGWPGNIQVVAQQTGAILNVAYYG